MGNLPKSDMLFGNGYDNVSMDGKGWLPLHWKEHPLLEDARQSKSTLWHANRLAFGNLLNHPPKGTLPNCVPMAFRWPTWQELGEESPAYWARLIPHAVISEGKVVRTASGESKPAAGEDRIWFPPWPHQGMALVSVRQVRPGDELLWNYRLHARADSKDNAEYPHWYEPVDD